MKSILFPVESVVRKIYLIRGQKVMTDSDLAVFYGIDTKVLNQAVKRNKDRFPVNFMFQLKMEEYKSLRSQTVTLNLKSQIVTSSWGGKRKLPSINKYSIN